MRAFRRTTEARAEEKLALLRRLRRQFDAKSLPQYTETQVEQSFNEQIFARIFDYATLLSHDGLSHHIQAKPHVKTTGRFPDFTIGTFGGITDRVVATVELKDPDESLDKPQGKEKLSAVQQAFQAMKGEQACRWVIACNYRELRLYRRVDLVNDNDPPPKPIVTAKLPDIRDKNDLAQLCAHFDRLALLGTSTSAIVEPRSELLTALERKHAATPIPEKPDHVRALFLFTPSVEEDFALFRLERRLGQAINKNDIWPKLIGVPHGGARPAAHFELEDGYIVATSADSAQRDYCKVTLSGLGQLQVSVSKKIDGNPISTEWLANVARFFVELVDDTFHGLSEGTRTGRVSPELREVRNVELVVAPEHRDASAPDRGKARTSDVLGVDFVYTPVLDKGPLLVADMVSELAIYFRSKEGGLGIDRGRFLQTLK